MGPGALIFIEQSTVRAAIFGHIFLRSNQLFSTSVHRRLLANFEFTNRRQRRRRKKTMRFSRTITYSIIFFFFFVHSLSGVLWGLLRVLTAYRHLCTTITQRNNYYYITYNRDTRHRAADVFKVKRPSDSRGGGCGGLCNTFFNGKNAFIISFFIFSPTIFII